MHIPTPGTLDHPDKVQAILGIRHKIPHAGAVYAAELLFNYQLTCPRLLEFNRTIFVLSDPRRALPRLVESGMYDEESATRNYTFRMRRLAEMAKRAAHGVVVTESDLESAEGISLVTGFLRLRAAMPPIRVEHPSCDVSPALLRWAVESYERHLFYIRGALKGVV
ncbi:MAG: hypothetical protein ACREGR_03855 [Minisyncoccia bacterium]